MMKPRNLEAARRFTERREREDQAPRLHDEVPALEVLALELSERRGEATQPETTHVRRIVVASAPAYFQTPCSDSNCVDGGHEYTATVMKALRDRQALFAGESTCQGTVADHVCERVLRYVGSAKYAKA
jgi:hypothetical protein